VTAARTAVDRESVARAERDLRYWRQRRATAEVVTAPERLHVVRFGSTVTLETAAGETVRYRIVGEDESDPRHGMISYVSPLAEALLGCRPGDMATLRDGDAEIVAIS
jgi:transcription elongation GreA/GreB family factor